MECTFNNRSSSWTSSNEEQEQRNERLRRGIAHDVAGLKAQFDAFGVDLTFETAETQVKQYAKKAVDHEARGITALPIEIRVNVTRTADGKCLFDGHDEQIRYDLDVLRDLAKCMPDSADSSMWDIVLRTWLSGHATGYYDGASDNDC